MRPGSLTFWPSVSILVLVKMEHKSPHEKTASAKLTFVVLSDAEKPSRSFKASKLQLTLVVLFGIVATGALSVVTLINTPMGRLLLPSYFSTQEEQLEKIRVLESKVDAVENQFTYLAAYNTKLRKALGDTVTSDTSMPEVKGPSTVADIEQPDRAQVSKGESVGAQPYEPSVGGSITVASDRESGRDVFPLLMPVQGFITRGVNYPIQHYGIDISAQLGEPVLAPAPGEVVFSDWTLTGGNTIIIAHPGDFMTVYKHCERVLVTVGAEVSRGEAIALVGSTGTTSTGPHLHFELWHNGKNLNPENYLLTKN
jgi:murein DD-endopeptidase MepM/ murein hydrolase activator NlpD